MLTQLNQSTVNIGRYLYYSQNIIIVIYEVVLTNTYGVRVQEVIR